MTSASSPALWVSGSDFWAMAAPPDRASVAASVTIAVSFFIVVSPMLCVFRSSLASGLLYDHFDQQGPLETECVAQGGVQLTGARDANGLHALPFGQRAEIDA